MNYSVMLWAKLIWAAEYKLSPHCAAVHSRDHRPVPIESGRSCRRSPPLTCFLVAAIVRPTSLFALSGAG